jgi:hypothetical protein
METSTAASARTIWVLGWLNIVAHIAAMAFAGIGMRPGTPGEPLADRLAYLSSAPLGWTLGWGMWMACALADLGFIAALASHAPRGSARAALAVTLATVGAGIDLIFDTIHIVVIPDLARGAERAVFLAFERMAWAVGAVVANGFYSLATLLITLELAGERRVGRIAHAAGVATFFCGMGLSAAGFVGSPRMLEIVSGPTIGAFIVWVYAAARDVTRAR